jgi:hypothetical protein
VTVFFTEARVFPVTEGVTALIWSVVDCPY